MCSSCQKYMYVYDIGSAMLCAGIVSMDQTLKMLGMTSVFVGGFMALILDNMIPGRTSRLTGRRHFGLLCTAVYITDSVVPATCRPCGANNLIISL